MALLDPPAIVCRVWHPREEHDLEDDELELELELDLHARGWRMCDCFSSYVPEGEFGHLSDRRLYEISQADFDRALELLREQDLPEYEDTSTTPLLGLRRASTRRANQRSSP